MSEAPQIRASSLHATLDALDEERTSVKDAVVASLDDAAIAEIRGAAGLAWMNAELQMELNDALMANLDAAGYEAFWRRAGLALARAGALTALAQGAMRIMGVDPAGMYKMLPRASSQVTRNMGEQAVTALEGGAAVRVVYSQIPAFLRRSQSYVRSAKATLMVPLLFLERSGEVAMDDSRLADGIADFKVTWDPK